MAKKIFCLIVFVIFSATCVNAGCGYVLVNEYLSDVDETSTNTGACKLIPTYSDLVVSKISANVDNLGTSVEFSVKNIGVDSYKSSYVEIFFSEKNSGEEESLGQYEIEPLAQDESASMVVKKTKCVNDLGVPSNFHCKNVADNFYKGDEDFENCLNVGSCWPSINPPKGPDYSCRETVAENCNTDEECEYLWS